MIQTKRTYLLIALLSVSKPAMAADIDLSSCFASLSSCRDSAVSSLLLAAGMYGGNSAGQETLSLTRSNNFFNEVFFGQGQFDGQNITLSYEGSSGRLDFSAGYIYTAPEKMQEAGAVLLGLDSLDQGEILLNNGESMTKNPWYVTLNLSKSFQLSDNIAVGVGSKTMLFSSPFLEKEKTDGRPSLLAMSLHLPVSYKRFFTVTPKIQWSRTLLSEDNPIADNFSAGDAEANQNTFYGGMSISFSY